jgi:hypothetical protein
MVRYTNVALGGLMVIVLATGPKVRGFKLGRGWSILREIKIRSMTSFGQEVNPSVPCRKILRHFKELRVWQRYYVGKIKGHLSPSFSCFATRRLLVTSRELWWMNQEWPGLICGTHNRLAMVAVHEAPCAIPPRNSNSRRTDGFR